MACPVCGSVLTEKSSDGGCLRCALSLGLGIASPAATESSSLAGYELMHELGRGSMGIVWLARERALDRLVALKVLAAGGDPQLASRLLREGQAVARLSHPNIVAIHALGGAGAETFLAMDFAEGGTLDERVNGQPLSPALAAGWIGKLADAVAHAHAAGIIHRDIKPSNVLLSASGEPQLADFGLAGPLAGRGDLTRANQVMGTPAYLAPELLERAGAASPAADIYGLGGLLYFCLTARAPFVGDSTAGILRQVAEADPISPRLLQPGVPRDLETICLKSLNKSPAGRYDSAAALRDDLSRYLRHEPIAARPVGRGGQALRWTRRHPNLAAGIGLAATVILLLAIGGPLVALRLDRSRRAATTAEATAEAINQFLQDDLLSQASPEAQGDHDVKLQVVLDRAAARIGERFAGQPAIEESLRTTLGQTYSDITDYPAARTQLERALKLRTRQFGPDDPGTLRLQAKLVMVLVGLGKYADAVSLGRRTWVAQRRLLGPEAADTLTTQNLFGNALRWQGSDAEAEAQLRPLVEIRRRLSGPEARETLVAMNNLAHVLIEEAKYPEAEALARKNLEIYRRRYGVDNPIALQVMNSLLVIYTREGRAAEAAVIGQETFELCRRVFGPGNNTTLMVQNNLALADRDLGQYEETLLIFRQLLEIRRRENGPESAMTLVTMINLSKVLLDLHRNAEAETLARQGLDGWLRTQGPDHPYTLSATAVLIAIYKSSERWADAEGLATPLLATRQRVQGPGYPETLLCESELGDILLHEGRYADAAARLRETVDLAAKHPWDDWKRAVAQSRLGEALLGLGQRNEAGPLLVAAAQELERDRTHLPADQRVEADRAQERLAQLNGDGGSGPRGRLSPREHNTP